MSAASDCPRVVLIVDDDRDVREAIAEVLLDNDLAPHEAANGREALDKVRTMPSRPCLILLDVMMPVMDAYAFRAAQLADADVCDIPVVVLTAHADAAKAARDLNAHGWLKKPVGLKTLLDLIESFCPPAAGTMTG